MATQLQGAGVLFPDATLQTTAAFTANNVLEVLTSQTWTPPTGGVTATFLCIGGGGAGGDGLNTGNYLYYGGGGGAGGLAVRTMFVDSDVSINIGSGGVAGRDGTNTSGGNTTVNTTAIIALGGGKGWAYNVALDNCNGGCGGGCPDSFNSSSYTTQRGGGGIGMFELNFSKSRGALGYQGSSTSTDNNGVLGIFGRLGGGGGSPLGKGMSGGGNGAIVNPDTGSTAGQNNTGGGGGGGTYWSGIRLYGANGGSGICIISWFK